MPSVHAAEFSTITFDYIIVGGGVAGLTVAARLAEDEKVCVGVVEAGRYVNDIPEINTPGYAGRTIANPEFDWMFISEPQKALHDRPVFQPRGKVLGGSSAMNFMQLSRATKEEYDSLEALGNKGWNWQELLKYFRKSEKLVSPTPEDAKQHNVHLKSEFHGLNGPLSKSYPIWFPDLHEPFLKSVSELGLEANTDPFCGENVGSFTSAFSIDQTKATRDYATTAFYEPNAHLPNLYLLTQAQVTKILTRKDSDGISATGIEYTQNEKTFGAEASCEVILCAGSFQSPQLLELSGIGDPQRLGDLNIAMIVDLPSVGRNLQDHPNVVVIQEVKPSTQSFEILSDPILLAEQIVLYETQKKGMFSSVPPSYALVPLDKLVDALTNAKILTEARQVTTPAMTGVQKQNELQVKWINDPTKAQLEIISSPSWLPIGQPGEISPTPGTRYNSFLGMLLHPFSRGTVHIKSADPLAQPAINPNYLAEQVDVDILVESVKFMRKLMTTGPLAQYHQRFVQPGPDIQTDAQIKEWVTKYIGYSEDGNCSFVEDHSLKVNRSTWHPIGTASMLPKEDGGVVDSKLIVYGTKNIRVVDASILPIQLSCHIQATVYAIAEKAADIIKEHRLTAR